MSTRTSRTSRTSRTAATPKQIRRLSRADLAANIRASWARADRDTRRRGRAWYREAHAWCERTAAEAGLPVRTVVGIVAALSPQTAWGRNLANAIAVIRAWADSPDAPVRIQATGNMIRKARAIYAGADPAEILGGDKVRAFYACIAGAHGSPGRVCLDRHAVAIAAGRALADGVAGVVLSWAGEYDRLAEVYRAVARELRIRAHELQAVTWVEWRQYTGVPASADDATPLPTPTPVAPNVAPVLTVAGPGGVA